VSNPKFATYFKYTRSQQKGILFLFGLVIVLQAVYFFVDYTFKEDARTDQNWLALQSNLDALKTQNQIDKNKIFPFNPNFISDYKGYKLGMSIAEIDRLLNYRKSNKYVNSAEEFQQVTKVSDELLQKIAPYFKFPEWIKNKNSNEFKNHTSQTYQKTQIEKIEVKDINQATKEDLIKVYGIGEAFANRILAEKEKLGGFVSMDQVAEIWGLSPEAVKNMNERFSVINLPKINKIKVNTASVKELMQIPYIKYAVAKNIVTFRSMKGDLKIADLTNIQDFPSEKLKIIALYLEF
jgi:DNA uptake protein ComE-like DNA-binding protein